MINKKSRLDLHIEKTEGLINYLVKRRHDSIKKSLIRPLYQEALKCLFLVIVILIDTLIPLEIFLDLPMIINVVLTFLTLGILLYVEMRIYNQLWGKKGRWSIKNYKKTYDN